MECVRLRAQDVDFEYHQIVIRDAKGQKARVVPLPERLEGPLRERENAPRARQPLESCFFEGAWGVAPQTGLGGV